MKIHNHNHPRGIGKHRGKTRPTRQANGIVRRFLDATMRPLAKDNDKEEGKSGDEPKE